PEASKAYIMPNQVDLSGDVDFEAFKKAVYAVIERHEILRTVFKEDESGEVRQWVLQTEALNFEIPLIDLSEQEHAEKTANAYIEQDGFKPFDLVNGPLIRACLFKLSSGKYRFYYIMHHIVSDGWSLGVLANDVFSYYNAYKNGQTPGIPPLKIQYKDYTSWHAAQLSPGKVRNDLDYWLEQFKGSIPAIEIPAERLRPGMKTNNGEILETFLSKEATRRLKKMTKDYEGTLFITLLGLWNVLLYRYTNQDDIVIGTAVAGRDHAYLEDQIGFYVNTLALKNSIPADKTFADFYAGIKANTLDAFSHQTIPFDFLVDELKIIRDMSRNPLFDIELTFQSVGSSVGEGGFYFTEETATDIHYRGKRNAKFDIEINALEIGPYLQLTLNYNTDIYSRELISQLLTHFHQLTNTILDNPNSSIGEYDFLSAAEKQQLLYAFNDTRQAYPSDKSVIELFEEQVLKTPDAIAIVYEQVRLSYRELNERSNQLAHYLAAKGVQADTLVPVCIERSAEMLIAILGIWKAGGAYVPLDPGNPEEHIHYMLGDTGAKVVLSSKQSKACLPSGGDIHIISLDEPGLLEQQPLTSPGIKISPQDLSYVIYTSGSTGRPKGVLVEHRGMLNHLFAKINDLKMDDRTVVAYTASYTFDISVWQMFSALICGGQTIVYTEQLILQPALLLNRMEEDKVSIVEFVPSYLAAVLLEELSVSLDNVQYLLVTGEAVGQPLLAQWFGHKHFGRIPVVNAYGPTEASDDITHHFMYATPESSNVPLGKPIQNLHLYILDARGQLCPFGMAGEICVSGIGVARGYLNREALTLEKFVTDPFRAGERMYKTGDLGRWLRDGTIQYLGRMDDQVKIRGNRIELGEVEKVLSEFEGIRNTVVAVQLINGEKSLVAYYTSDTAIDKTIIKGYLLQKLPDYMVPGYYVALDSIPLTANGKVDRKALPPIEEADIIRRAYIAPENEMEQQLVEIWQQVLGVEKVGTTDNFFELGGHSLKATQLMSTYFKAFKVRLKLQDLFSSTSIKEHVHLLSNTGKDSYIAIPRTDIAESYPVSNAQHMIWTLSQTREGLVSYNVPGVTGLDNDMDRASLEKALNTLIERHEILRTVFRGDEHGNVRQWILSPEELGFQMAYHDIREEADQEEFIRSYIYENDLFKPFDMENGPLFRVKLFRKSDGYLLYYLLHHIITDGLSGEIARRDVWVAYNAYKEQAQPSLPDLTIQYKDYASWQQQQLAENKYAHLRDYWMKQLAGEIPLLDLPAQKPRPKVKTHRGRYLQTYLSKELTKKMYAFSQEQGGSLFMTLLAVWNVLLSRYTAQHDITIGAPIAGRDYPDLENQLGCYINTLVLRNQVDTEKSFKWLYDRVKNSTLDAYHNQMYPFDLIVKDLNVKRNVSRSNVLFDIMLVLQNYEAKNAMPVVERDTTTIYDLGMRLAKLDIEIGYYERGEHILFRLKFNTDVYEQPLIEQLMRHFKQLAAALLEHADRAIKEVDFLTAAEKQQHVAEFNSTQADYGKGKTILDLLDVQAAEQADRTAIIFEDKVLSYQQLHEHARQLAGYLREKYGVLRDDLVGIKLERSEWLPVVVLGILRSGAAYVPIDTRYPQERIDYIVKDGNFKVLIDEAELEAFRSVRTNYGKSALPLVTQPEDVAYCIYTSGSTGTPKGVLNTHAGLYNRLVWMRDYLAVDQSAVFLQKTPYTFDVSVWELILPFITGTTLVVARPEGHKDPVYLQDLIEKRRVGIIHFVPSMLGAFLMDVKEDSCSSLSHIVCSGEELPAAMVETCKSILSTARIHNLYGPTEAGIDVTAIDLTNVDVAQQGVSIGAPVSNTSIYIVNESFQLQPLGVPGELWISGVQVAKGYLNLPQLTAERFLDDPFSPGKRVYRTGDIARWLPDGTIQYFGRMDNQVKIRGNRIEPGEIEKAISTFADIKWAIVAAKEVRNETALVAYYAADTAIDKDALRDYLQEKLPEYMVPGFYLALDHIPLTASGKVDRKALPAITGEDIIKSEYVAPRNEMESMLAKIWEQILGMEQVGIHDNFFRMGGDSILSIRLVSRINKQFDVTLSIGQLYEAGTIAEISELVKDNRNNAGDKDKIKEGIADRIDQLKNRVLNVIPNADRIEDIYPMSDIQKGMVTLSAVNPETGLYHQQAVFPVPAVDVDLFKQAFAYLVQKHPSLRTRFDLSTYGEEIQIIEKDRDFTIGYHDLQHLERAEQEAFIKEFMAAERKRPFNVESAALWRLDLFAASQATSVFLFQFHHAILDGWSHASLNTELFKVYRQLAKGISLEPEQLGATYKDAVIDELYEKENPDTIRFWQEELGDYKRLDIFSNETAAQGLTRVVDTEFKNKLEERCKTDNVPVRTVLYAAFVYALKSLTYEDDFVVGMVANNRPVMEDGDRILGCFLNSIPVRNRLERSYDLTWSSYFKHTAAQLTALKRKERLTLYEISKATNEPSVNGSPFFDVLFNYIDFHIYEEIGSEKRSVKEQQLNVDSFAITNTIFDFEVSHSGNSLVLAYKLRRPLSSGITLDTIHQWICQILAVYLHSPNSKLKETSLLSAEERNKVLSAFNATTVDYGTGKTLLELQKSTALSYPEAIAVSYQGNSLSFYEYDRLSGKVAAYLREHYGLQPNDLVGVRLERSEWLPVVIMGILKAGGAYVPIDVEYPEERLQYIASDSNYKLCIDEVLLDAIKAETDLNIQTQEEVNVTGNTLAYAIYTSGSTGNPKGVLNTHAGIYNRLLWMRDSLEIGPADIVLQKTPYTFDVSVSELLTPFITGSKLVIAEPGGHKDPLYLQEVIAAEKITIVHFVPSMLEIFLEGLDPSKCKSLKHVMCSGEALPALTVAEFKAKLPWVRIHNFYGPTEAAIEVTAVELTAVDTVSTGVSIGKPVANTRIYIVDKQMSPQPIGVPGELLIEGVQVARGYLNQAALTEAQFIDSPFNEGQRIYRTGDLAKWLPNGEIAYLGRIDDQVKVHGYRIEPGEIAYYLGEREDIETAVVLVRKSGSGQKELIAFIVAKKEQDVAALRTYLAAKLPFYMVPAHFVQVSEIPLNASGKIDKKRLLAADQVELFNRAAYVAPRNDRERALIAVCEAVLNRKDIGMTDSFYELGGDSIKSIQMVSRLRQMGYTLKVAEVLRTPVLEEMAKLLLLDENKADQSEVSGAVVLTPIQHYLFEHFPAPAHFNQAIALKCEEPLDLDILDQCLTEIVRHHDALRMVFKQHNGSCSQFNNDSGAKSYRIGSYDLTAAENPMEEMEVLSSQLQASFELAEGPLVKLGHFKLNDGERLVIIIHHLVIDGVSW
ncbi:MAG TPA: amino acid adenylation domain-containing protein, partial [Chitinophaga sp.]